MRSEEDVEVAPPVEERRIRSSWGIRELDHGFTERRSVPQWISGGMWETWERGGHSPCGARDFQISQIQEQGFRKTGSRGSVTWAGALAGFPHFLGELLVLLVF